MFRTVIPAREAWDPMNEEFVSIKDTRLILEHSLLSISKWEMKWKVPFMGEKESMTDERMIDYIRCMTINQVDDPRVYYMIPSNILLDIKKYIEDPMTAKVFYNKKKKTGARQVITSDDIYCWMAMYRIPFEAEKWHLNRLMTLIQCCSDANAPKEKMSRAELLARNARLNAERKAKLNTKG